MLAEPAVGEQKTGVSGGGGKSCPKVKCTFTLALTQTLQATTSAIATPPFLSYGRKAQL